MLSSSRLLPVTIAAITFVLAIKSVALLSSTGSLQAFPAETAQVIAVASETASVSMIGRARAASPEPPKAPAADAPSQRSAGASPPMAEMTPRPGAAPPLNVASLPSSADTAVDPLRPSGSAIEERERAVSEREAAVAAADQRLAQRVAELQALQARLQALDGGLKERDEANWTGLVKMYEAMKPRDAATIFNSLDKPVLLEILDRMKPVKASPVLASMDAEKARQVTSDLAAKRTQTTTVTN